MAHLKSGAILLAVALATVVSGGCDAPSERASQTDDERTGQTADQRTRQIEHDFVIRDPVTAVRLEHDIGNTVITTHDAATTTIRRTIYYTGDRPDLDDTHRLDDAALVLGAGRCRDDCEVAYEVVVPAGTAVTGAVDRGDISLAGVATADLRTDTGQVRLDDIDGTVAVETTHGDISLTSTGDADVSTDTGVVRLDDIDGTVSVGTNQGDIAATNITGPIDAETLSGRIDLRLIATTSVRAMTSSGDITVGVPSDEYRVNVDSTSGDTNVGIVNNPSAENELQLRSTSGHIILTTDG